MIEVFPPHGFVKLSKWIGTEVDIVNAARVSFHTEIEQLGIKDEGLISFLMKEQHGSPFEQGFISMWHIRLPIFVMREWVKHRIGVSTNEESGRYVKLRPDFYIPQYARTQQGKPGHYRFERADNLSERLQSLVRSHSEHSYDLYESLLTEGVAKEQARIVLPVNIYTEIRWVCNSRSLMHFLSLRNSEHAMYEIRRYAEALEEMFALHMPNVHNAFVQNGRKAP